MPFTIGFHEGVFLRVLTLECQVEVHQMASESIQANFVPFESAFDFVRLLVLYHLIHGLPKAKPSVIRIVTLYMLGAERPTSAG